MASAATAVAAISVLAFGLARGDEWSDSRLPPEKLEIIERQARFTAGEFDKPGPPLDKQVPELVSTPEPWPQGIIEDGQSPFLSGTYSFRNRWQWDIDGGHFRVYAGAEGRFGDPSQGVVVVIVNAGDFSAVAGASGSYEAPAKSGALRIVSAEGEVLTLQAEDGSKLLFDVASRRFLSPETGQPLATPQPPTPSPTPKTGRFGSSAGAVATVAIDAGSLANSATSLGAREACGKLAAGETVAIDITVDGVPALLGEDGGGIIGFQFTLVYDPSKVKVVASDTKILLAANDGSSVVSLGDGTPDSDDKFLVAVADFSASEKAVESGSGVLARITLEGVGAGVSALSLSAVKVVDAANNVYAIGQVLDAQVAVDVPCP